MNKLFKLALIGTLLISFGACKPKQSSYQSVYEAAKEREIQDETQTTTNVNKPAYPVYNSSTNYDNEKVRQEKITAVYEADASGLRAYNVVIASLAVKPSAEGLKAKMERDGYKVILAQNEQGLYRVIIASFDDKPSAVDKRNEITSAYQSKGGVDYLKSVYGIPFNDLWILQRQY